MKRLLCAVMAFSLLSATVFMVKAETSPNTKVAITWHYGLYDEENDTAEKTAVEGPFDLSSTETYTAPDSPVCENFVFKGWVACGKDENNADICYRLKNGKMTRNFVKWFIKNKDTIQVDAYALWEPAEGFADYYSCNVIFDANGGTFTGGQTKTEASLVGLMGEKSNIILDGACEIPVKADHCFMGWYSEPLCKTRVCIKKAGDFGGEPVRFYAKWEKVTDGVVYTPPQSSLTAIYGQQLRDVESQLGTVKDYLNNPIAGTWSWTVDGVKIGQNTVVGGVGSHTYKVIFKTTKSVFLKSVPDPYNIDWFENDNWDGTNRYLAGPYTISFDQTIRVEVDKSNWGKSNGEGTNKNYVAENGTTSAEVTTENLVWLKEENADGSTWFGLDNSKGTIEIGSRFWVKCLDKNDGAELEKYTSQIDAKHQASVKDDKMCIFLTGVTKPNGEEYTNFTELQEFFVQIPDGWDRDEIMALFISSGEDEVISTSNKSSVLYPVKDTKFQKLKLGHFSPYVIYEASADQPVLSPKTGDSANTVLAMLGVTVSTVVMLAVGYLHIGKKQGIL